MPEIHLVRVVEENGKVDDTAASVPFPCDITCRKPQVDRGLVKIYKVKETNFTITFSIESPQYYPLLEIDKDAYQQDNYYATSSFCAEMP